MWRAGSSENSKRDFGFENFSIAPPVPAFAVWTLAGTLKDSVGFFGRIFRSVKAEESRTSISRVCRQSMIEMASRLLQTRIESDGSVCTDKLPSVLLILLGLVSLRPRGRPDFLAALGRRFGSSGKVSSCHVRAFQMSRIVFSPTRNIFATDIAVGRFLSKENRKISIA